MLLRKYKLLFTKNKIRAKHFLYNAFYISKFLFMLLRKYKLLFTKNKIRAKHFLYNAFYISKFLFIFYFYY
jgi:hypothetical protein